MRISLFGNLRINSPGGPLLPVNTNRLQSLLAYLILHGDGPLARERLAFTLWPASTESQARTNLRQLLHNLKRVLPAECDLLVTDHLAIEWKRDASCEIDVLAFQDAISQASAARSNGDSSREMRYLKLAAELYEDDLLPALYDDWIVPLREDFRRQLASALERLAVLFDEQEEHGNAICWAERLVTLDLLNEANHQLLIRLHAANRDRASAVRAYHRCRQALRRELGVDPGPATQRLFEQILKSDAGEPSPEKPHPATAKHAPELQRTRTLVGRAYEWRTLASAWQTVLENGPRIVFIAGEPGIGKTRLAEELYQSCIQQGYAAARSRCYSGRGQVAYSPVAEWLRSDALHAGWSGLGSQHLAELARLLPEINEPRGANRTLNPGQSSMLAEAWQRLRFHESLNTAFAHCRKPLLLYMDDMQWCDSATFEWLNAFITSSAASGTLLLGTVRAEETGREHPFTSSRIAMQSLGMVEEIALGPLDARETQELAQRESAEPLEAPDIGEIFRATRGNPLFVLESVRAGLQSTRVHAVIAARLNQLSAAAYELAGLASVVGRPFSFELLEKATDWDDVSVSQALEQLWERRIIESREQSQYDFTHDRVREVALAELTVVRRRYWHRRIARALAEVYENEIESWNGQIASHFEQAGMAREAIERYRLAAVYARQRYADREAAGLLTRALTLCRGFPESERMLLQELDLLTTLGPALVTTEGYSAARVGETYTRALELSKRFLDRQVFAVLSGLWVFHMVRGDLEQARQVGVDFLTRAELAPTPGLMQAANFVLGGSEFHLGQLEAGREHMRSALYANSGPTESVMALFAGPNISVFCQVYLAHLTWHCGNETEAHAHASEAIASAKRMHHPFSEAIALDYAAMLSAFEGNSSAALECGTEAAALCTRHGFAYYLAMAQILTGWAQAAEEDAKDGLAQLRAGMDGMRRLGAQLRLPYYFALLAETLQRTGQPDEALASLSNGFAFAAGNGEQWAEPELHRVQGNLLSAKGKAELASTSFHRAMEAARQSRSLGWERKFSALKSRTRIKAAAERS
jgi:DNA-binding SARP family transcriptional activator/predicted ATPase